MDEQAAEVPLVERMRRIPKDWREMREIGPTHHQNVPYGHMLHEAADRLDLRDRQVAAIVTWLEANQPDVFRRGLWDAMPKGAHSASGES